MGSYWIGEDGMPTSLQELGGYPCPACGQKEFNWYSLVDDDPEQQLESGAECGVCGCRYPDLGEVDDEP
jgi:hypothetical protein